MKSKVVTLSFIILFSIFLWISVSLSENFIVTIKAPIKVTDLPINNGVSNISADEVFIQLKGNGWNLAKIFLGTPEEFSISARRKLGKHREQLRSYVEANQWITSSFQVIEISPPSIEFSVGKILSKKVKIAPILNLNYKDGFGLVSNLKISPDSVEIFGPGTLLKNIDSIVTEPLQLQNISENIKDELNLVVPQGIEINRRTCELQFEVQKIVETMINNIVIESLNVPQLKEMDFYPNKISVTLRGGIQRLGKITRDSIRAYINYWDVINDDGKSVKPKIEIPKYTSILNVEPKYIELIIKQY
jgi:YbbR domain-containing protein